jgi:hypothetical protein
MWPPDEIVVRVAYMDSGAGILFRISPAITRALALIDSPEMRRAIAQKWDKKTREHAQRYEDEAEEMTRTGEWPKSEGPKPEYGPDSTSECSDLLGRIVPVALDAVTSHRELFVVSSLNHLDSESRESEDGVLEK